MKPVHSRFANALHARHAHQCTHRTFLFVARVSPLVPIEPHTHHNGSHGAELLHVSRAHARLQPQNEHIELHQKRFGHRLDHFERKCVPAPGAQRAMRGVALV